MAKQPTDYFSYLLRMWRTGKESAWKASLEDPQTGERRGFGSLEVLFGFLRRKTASSTEPEQSNLCELKGD